MKLEVFRLNTIEFHRVGSGGVKSRGRFLSISAMACLITGECVTDVIMNHEKRQAGTDKSIGRTEEENGSHLLLLVFHHPLSISFIPDLKLSFSANPSHCSLLFFLRQDWLHDFPDFYCYF